MRKLDPNATVEVEVSGTTFVYKVLSCREWLAKCELRKADENGESTWGAIADAAAYGLKEIKGTELPPTADALMDNLTMGELVELARKSSDACALVPEEKKTSD